MSIKINYRSEPKPVSVRNMKQGSAFLYDGTLWVVSSEVYDNKVSARASSAGTYYLCISLEDGEMCRFYEDGLGVPVDIEITVKG